MHVGERGARPETIGGADINSSTVGIRKASSESWVRAPSLDSARDSSASVSPGILRGPASWRLILRAKGAGAVIEALTSDDALTRRRRRMSDRALRRLFDRLVTLGPLRDNAPGAERARLRAAAGWEDGRRGQREAPSVPSRRRPPGL
ncbi:Protein of unknown function [Rhizobiales bacterium GAS191]|nr:Protein of unknown function [Rhizobiales bacterium GAS191]